MNLLKYFILKINQTHYYFVQSYNSILCTILCQNTFYCNLKYNITKLWINLNRKIYSEQLDDYEYSSKYLYIPQSRPIRNDFSK